MRQYSNILRQGRRASSTWWRRNPSSTSYLYSRNGPNISQTKLLSHVGNWDRHFGTTAQYDRPISIIHDIDMLDEIPLEDTRNFCFIAHVDHGVSYMYNLYFLFLNYFGEVDVEQHPFYKWKEIKLGITCT